MSYTALYRKLRPKIFADVVGQHHIVRTLVNQIKTERISHAYLFCGTRGTGKTSTARLFAHAINCLNPQDGEPCNKCEACEAITSQRSLNVIEIDAASNNSVDNIRDIKEEVKYPPADGKYKVYIIDEVHMLSSGAFNALLKTLEEPPEYVIFILATTDPQKILPTIHSRCQRFDFRRITTADQFKAIKNYLTDSDININIEDNALTYVCQLSDGSMRDALSILDQCSAFYYNQLITLENVQETVGSVDKKVFFELCSALTESSSEKCLEIISELVIKGRDISQFVSELIMHFRNLLIIRNIGENSTAIDMSLDNSGKLKLQAQMIGQETLIHFINTFSLLHNQLRYSSNERILLEIACIKLCNPSAESSLEATLMRIERLESMLDGVSLSAKEPEKHQSSILAESSKQTHLYEKAVPEDINIVINQWKSLLSEFVPPLKTYLQKTSPEYLEGDLLYLVTENPTNSSLIKINEQSIREALQKKFGKQFNINVINRAQFDELHKKIYGAADDSLDNFRSSFTDKINMDIIFEK